MRTFASRVGLVVLAAAVTPTFALPVPTRMALNMDGTRTTGENVAIALSANGRFALFQASADDMIAGDANGVSDLVLMDRDTGSLDLVTIASDGTQVSTEEIFLGSVSDDGRFVAFGATPDTLDPADTSGNPAVFLRDRLLRTTRRVSVAHAGRFASGRPLISADGRRLLYTMHLGDRPDPARTFIVDLQSGETRNLSISEVDGRPRGTGAAALSADGSKALLVASGLLPGDPDGISQAYVYDWDSRSLVRACTTVAGVQSETDCRASGLSANGRYAVVHTGAGNLGYPPVPGGAPDYHVYLKDLESGVLELIDALPDGSPAARGVFANSSFHVALAAWPSDDGRYVIFHHGDWILDGPHDRWGAYVRDRAAGRTMALFSIIDPIGAGNGRVAGMSRDGQSVLFTGGGFAVANRDRYGGEPLDVFVSSAQNLPVDLHVEQVRPDPASPFRVDTVITNQGSATSIYPRLSLSIEQGLHIKLIDTSAISCATVTWTQGSVSRWHCVVDPIEPGAQRVIRTILYPGGEPAVRLRAAVTANETEAVPDDNQHEIQFAVPTPPPDTTPTEGGGGGAIGFWIAAFALLRRLIREAAIRIPPKSDAFGRLPAYLP